MNRRNKDTPSYWQPVPAACALAGIIVFIFATYGPPASSSGFVSILKGFLQVLAPDYVAAKEHYRMLGGPGSWLMTFVLGMGVGGFIGGRTIAIRVDDIPAIWRQRFGANSWLRYGAAFTGGFLILFASRLAGGCTLGLFMSGTTQMALSGIYFGGVIFLTAMITARLIYGKTGSGDTHD